MLLVSGIHLLLLSLPLLFAIRLVCIGGVHSIRLFDDLTLRGLGVLTPDQIRCGGPFRGL